MLVVKILILGINTRIPLVITWGTQIDTSIFEDTKINSFE